MRPFKFFFISALAFIIIFSLAKIAIIALIFAAIMSFIFFLVRGLADFLGNLSWDRRTNHAYKNREYNEFLDLPEHPILGTYEKKYNPLEREKIIIIK